MAAMHQIKFKWPTSRNALGLQACPSILDMHEYFQTNILCRNSRSSQTTVCGMENCNAHPIFEISTYFQICGSPMTCSHTCQSFH
eukprot:scaffold16612_cov35-Attheya_sp.AAC.1